jgi:hypothetical protein
MHPHLPVDSPAILADLRRPRESFLALARRSLWYSRKCVNSLIRAPTKLLHPTSSTRFRPCSRAAARPPRGPARPASITSSPAPEKLQLSDVHGRSPSRDGPIISRIRAAGCAAAARRDRCPARSRTRCPAVSRAEPSGRTYRRPHLRVLNEDEGFWNLFGALAAAREPAPAARPRRRPIVHNDCLPVRARCESQPELTRSCPLPGVWRGRWTGRKARALQPGRRLSAFGAGDRNGAGARARAVGATLCGLNRRR